MLVGPHVLGVLLLQGNRTDQPQQDLPQLRPGDSVLSTRSKERFFVSETFHDCYRARPRLQMRCGIFSTALLSNCFLSLP